MEREVRKKEIRKEENENKVPRGEVEVKHVKREEVIQKKRKTKK